MSFLLRNMCVELSVGGGLCGGSRGVLETPRRGTCQGTALDMDTINPNIVRLQYAVRGKLVARAVEVQKELNAGQKKPFTKVIRANLGDAHAMGQKPLTFIRQVLACGAWPPLIESAGFPEDVKKRAKELLAGCNGKSVGSYTMSFGIDRIRKNVAASIEQRDGYPSDPNNVVLVNGASVGIKNVLELFTNTIDGKPTGIMIPTPQYPLYSASIAEFGLVPVRYFLDEANNWGLNMDELQRAYDDNIDKVAVRAIVVINPGNPTGQVIEREFIEKVIHFAYERKLFIFADQVYQDNIYAGSEFHSVKKVMKEIGGEIAECQEVASFMSMSKGFMGECGLRGGWMELVNFDPDVKAQLLKSISANLCPNVLGQFICDCVANPPKKGEPSYDLYMKEKAGVLNSLAERATLIYDAFTGMQGFTVNKLQGAMYAFPRFEIPQKAIDEAREKKLKPDVFYALQLLEETGICVVPGSGFGQLPGTYHFRTTILPQKALLQEMLEIFRAFHDKFTKQYS